MVGGRSQARESERRGARAAHPVKALKFHAFSLALGSQALGSRVWGLYVCGVKTCAHCTGRRECCVSAHFGFAQTGKATRQLHTVRYPPLLVGNVTPTAGLFGPASRSWPEGRCRSASLSASF
jgi:hypothetical protein